MYTKKLMVAAVVMQMVLISCAFMCGYSFQSSLVAQAVGEEVSQEVTNENNEASIQMTTDENVVTKEQDVIPLQCEYVSKSLEKMRTTFEKRIAAQEQEERKQRIEAERIAAEQARLAEEQAKAEAQKVWLASLGEVKAVPNYCGTFKSYMSYRAITKKSSPQYKLQYSTNTWTDANGMRRCGDDYVIAVGSYYGDYVGQRLLVTMVNGTQFTATIGDFKADAHTDSSNRYNPHNKSVLEFLVDSKKLNRKIKQMGDVSYLPDINLQGKISHMQIINN